jgi:hypothetical protein
MPILYRSLAVKGTTRYIGSVLKAGYYVNKIILSLYSRAKGKRIDKNTLHVHYKSKRRMIDFYIGFVKGVGAYFKTPVKIQKLSEEEVDVHLGD